MSQQSHYWAYTQIYLFKMLWKAIGATGLVYNLTLYGTSGIKVATCIDFDMPIKLWRNKLGWNCICHVTVKIYATKLSEKNEMRKTNRKKKYKTLLESIKKGLSSWIRLIKDLYGRLTIEIKTFLLKLLYYSAIKRNEIGSSVETWMDLESVIQSEVSQKEKYKYSILTCICRT